MFKVLMLFMLAAPACALTLLTEDNPPFSQLSADGMRVSGISTALLDEMARRAKLPVVHQLLPWARALALAQMQADHCVYSTVRLAEREHKFLWLGPLTHNRWALFASHDFKGRLRTLEDARPYKIAGAQASAPIQWLASKGFANLEFSSTDELNAAKLAAGRIDLWISPYYRGQAFIERSKVPKVAARWWVREVDYYLACSLQTSPAKIAALEAAWRSMQQDGSANRLSGRYAQHMPNLPKLAGED